jgi:AraC family transcriptional regulator
MLAETSDALVDIALSVGFHTQAHFTTVFKTISGSTPYPFSPGTAQGRLRYA